MLAPIRKSASLARSPFAYRVARNAKFRFEWHFHEEYELTLVVRSQGVRFVGDSISGYRDGDLVLLGPRVPHTWQSEPQEGRAGWNTARVIHFREDFLGPNLFENLELRHIKRMLETSARGLCFASDVRNKAAAKIMAMSRMSTVRRVSSFLELLDMLANSRKAMTIAGPGFVPSLDLTKQRRIDMVCKYVNEHYARTISQAEVVDLVGMGASAFSTFFKKSVGLTFVQYVNELRISHACRMLVESDLPILEISMRAGFYNLSNFNRRFLQIKKMSPRAYRLMYTANGANSARAEAMTLVGANRKLGPAIVRRKPEVPR